MEKHRNGWQIWAARLLLPATLFVALLPRGFVPDLDAWRQGQLTLTFCRVGSGPTDDSHKTSGQEASLPVCAFGLLPMQSMAVEPTALRTPAQWVVAIVSLFGDSLPHGFLWMGGLGARGPPMATAALPSPAR